MISGSSTWIRPGNVVGVQMNVGAVDVSSQTVAFERRGLDGTLLGVVDLDLPERVLRTRAVWWTFEEGCLPEQTYQDLPGAVHAAEHAAIGLLPLFASCDRWDIGGVSTEFHPDTGATTIFIYDGVPGGAGFTERGAHVVHEWIGATLQAVTFMPLHRWVPGVHSIAQVRQRKRAAEQIRSRCCSHGDHRFLCFVLTWRNQSCHRSEASAGLSHDCFCTEHAGGWADSGGADTDRDVRSLPRALD